jgi:hypothetical protein
MDRDHVHRGRRATGVTPSGASPIEQIRTRIEADPSLQQKLSEPDDPAVFIALAVEAARAHGIVLAAEQIDTILASRSSSTAASADGGGERLPPPGWLPVQTHWQDRELHVDWAYFGRRRLREPFFEESVLRIGSKPFNRLWRYSTPISALDGWLRKHPGVPPTGFIFHMSRCGSTLVSQMLAAMAGTVVVSEAAPIDTVVEARRTRPDLSDAQHAAWLRWIIGALGQPRSGDERHLFVKLDSWHTLALPLFRRAFPAVPWIFVYRDPVEVLVSQLRQHGMHMVPGMVDPDLFGFGASQATLAPEKYCAQVLERICDGVLRQYAPDTALLVNYRQLPAALWTGVLPHFGVPCSNGDRAAMVEAARYDAKNPYQAFSADSAAKQEVATDAIRSAAAGLGGQFARLEALRQGA